MRFPPLPGSRRLLAVVLLAVCGVGFSSQTAFAQADLDAQLAALKANQTAFEQQVQTMAQSYQAADEAGKAAIEAKFAQMGETYQQEVVAANDALMAAAKTAPSVSEEVGAWATGQAYGSNDFATAALMAKKTLAANPENPAGLNLYAQSLFNLMRFEESEAAFAKAKAAGKLSPQFAAGAQNVTDYKALWAKEQAIRAKQASMNLPRIKFTIAGPDGEKKGEVLIELFEEEAPNTVASMISLVESGFYDGVRFFRVIPAFMVQTGDPNSKELGREDYGTGGPGYNIPDEFNRPDARKHFRGSLSMAKTARPDTGGSQFFITTVPTSHLNGAHTVFGRVLSGQELIDGIAQVDVTRPGGGSITRADVIQKAEVVSKRNHPYTPKTLPES